ncbi:MAG: hypothetical protein H7833_18035 [Magnetococcus sp. DMHC-1]
MKKKNALPLIQVKHIAINPFHYGKNLSNWSGMVERLAGIPDERPIPDKKITRLDPGQIPDQVLLSKIIVAM